jgi:hypothetical protein
MNDIDKPEKVALLQIEGPDEDGCVWACSPGGRRDIWCQNLGPAEKVAEKLSHWLASYDQGVPRSPWSE